MSDAVEKLAFSVDEAAMRANIGRDGIYQAIRENRLEAKKAGRRTLIPAEALRRFIENLPPLPSAAGGVKKQPSRRKNSLPGWVLSGENNSMDDGALYMFAPSKPIPPLTKT